MDGIVGYLSAQKLELGTLLSVCLAIVLAAVGYRRTRAEDRKRFTLGMLMGYSHSTELLRALHFVREHAQPSKGKTQVDPAVAERLAIILPHFQSIALATKNDLLERDIVLSARYGSMKAIWDNYYHYVVAQRRELGRPLLYVELEEFLHANAAQYEENQRPLRQRFAQQTAIVS